MSGVIGMNDGSLWRMRRKQQRDRRVYTAAAETRQKEKGGTLASPALHHQIDR